KGFRGKTTLGDRGGASTLRTGDHARYGLLGDFYLEHQGDCYGERADGLLGLAWSCKRIANTPRVMSRQRLSPDNMKTVAKLHVKAVFDITRHPLSARSGSS